MRRLRTVLAPVLIAIVMLGSLTACGEQEIVESDNPYVHEVMAEVPVGEAYEADGVKLEVSNVNVKLYKKYYELTFDLAMTLPNEKEYVEKYAYADGKHISVFPDQLNEGYGQLYPIREKDGGWFVDVYDKDHITSDHKFQLELALSSWDGKSVVFDLT